MQRIIVMTAIIVLSLAAAASVAVAQEQQSGSELRFDNVDQIRNRPSDIHIGSDPEYRPGMEEDIGGSDTSGYQKGTVEPDHEYYEERTYYKRVDEDESKPQPKRWDH